MIAQHVNVQSIFRLFYLKINNSVPFESISRQRSNGEGAILNTMNVIKFPIMHNIMNVFAM